MKRPPKHTDLIPKIRSAVVNEDFLLTEHAKARMAQRKVALTDLLYALTTGWHEAVKDEYSEEFRAWRYAVRGRTVDRRELRVAVVLDPDLMVITVIDLGL